MRLGLQPSMTKAFLINIMSLFPSSEVNHTQLGLLLLTTVFGALKAVITQLHHDSYIDMRHLEA